MKKIILISAAIMASFTLSAQTITKSCKITMKGVPSGTPDELRIYEIAEASATAFYEGVEATHLEQNTLPTSVNIYAKQSYGVLANVALPDISGMPITIMPNAEETNYSFTFGNIKGDVKVEDMLMDSVIVATSGLVYEFTAPAVREPIANRFRIYTPFTPDEGELAVCAYYNSIEIKNNPYTTDIVVKDLDGNVVLTKTARSTPQTISLEGLAAGHYVLVIGEKSFEFCNKPVSNN